MSDLGPGTANGVDGAPPGKPWAMTYRLQRPQHWIVASVLWGVAVSAVWVRGWYLSTARPWFPGLLLLTVVITLSVCRYWWPRCHT